MRNCILFTLMTLFVLIVNSSILASDLMYAEQPMLYTANQGIHSIGDLLAIYLHPRMLDVFSIPFFRPSGHFLIYQLLTPLLGWHNTRGFLAVNLIFLALTGFFLLKCYELLFPGFKAGGYLAFSLYLMHPALFLSRLISLHFEFAHVFFCVLSFYCFVLFCRQGLSDEKRAELWLLGSLFCYGVAVTFKEPAVMLGPVLVVYFILFGQKRATRLGLSLLALWTVATAVMALYLSLAWPSLMHPLAGSITAQTKWAASVELMRDAVGLPSHLELRGALQHAQLVWRDVLFSPFTQAILGGFLCAVLLLSVRLSFVKDSAYSHHKKSFLFLAVAAVLFLVLPVNWAMGLPWHLSLSLLCLSLMAGFSFDYGATLWCSNQRVCFTVGVVLAALIGGNADAVNRIHLAQLQARSGFAAALARNAVLHPPVLQEAVTASTLLLVEDSRLHDSYALGNGSYPLFLKEGLNYDAFEQAQAFSFLKYQPIYNGYLFRWAYLRPTLQEELYPFAVNHLEAVPDAVLHRWLQHYSDLVCVGYDAEAHWQERTAELKRNLLREKANRLLRVHSYLPYAAQLLRGTVLYTKRLSLPDPQLCQYECDQNVNCRGFTYEHAHDAAHSTLKCQFYEALATGRGPFCATCIGFVKD